MTDRVILGEDERRAQAEARDSAAREAQEGEVKALLETSTCVVRRRRDGSVHLAQPGSPPRHFVFDRRDIGALRAVLALLEGGR